MLMSMAMTEGIGFKIGQEQQGMVLDFIDVRRAYSYADSKRTVYVDLPLMTMKRACAASG